jgi:hypothetical protein
MVRDTGTQIYQYVYVLYSRPTVTHYDIMQRVTQGRKSDYVSQGCLYSLTVTTSYCLYLTAIPEGHYDTAIHEVLLYSHIWLTTDIYKFV